MAAPHVSATAALLIATSGSGAHPTPGADRGAPQGRPRATSAPPGYDRRYGAGLVDARAALTAAGSRA